VGAELGRVAWRGRCRPRAGGGRVGRFTRLRESLSKSRRASPRQIAAAAFDPTDALAWERLEEALIQADVGVTATAELVRRLEARGELGDLGDALADEAAALLGAAGILHVQARPSVILVVGVNGTGKTTTIGKLASKLSEHGLSVVVAAADTFRAAAEEAARDLGGAGRRGLRRLRRGRRPRSRRLRRDRGPEARGATSSSSTTAGGYIRKRT